MRTAVLLSALALTGMASAQVFTSDFENWTGPAPDGWEGAKTSIALDSVTQVSDNPHGGLYAVRLKNTSSSHKRFSTQSVAVSDGLNYNVSFWVRGNGNIRVGLYDGRSSGSGYAGYVPTSYVAVSSTEWMQVTETIAAAHDTVDAEFIIDVQSTVAPEHLVVDDVNISEAGALVPTSIHDIQYTTDPSGDSPYAGQTVLTGGIVTADLPAAGDGYFVQSGSGPWSGVYVYDTDHSPAIGDSVTFSAAVSEYFNLTELGSVAGYTVVSSGNTVPTPLDVLTGEVALEPLESVLVRVVNSTCTEAPGGANFGKYKVDDGSGYAVVGKAIYTTVPDPVVGNVLNVTGVNYYSFAEYDIEPRMASDIDLITGIADVGELSGISVGPNPATDLLHVDLGQATGNAVDYTLTDMQGRTVQTGELINGRTQINVVGLADGLYHFTARSNASVKTLAVQVAH